MSKLLPWGRIPLMTFTHFDVDYPQGRRRLISRSYSTLGLAGVGGEERRSLNSLLFLHRADSSSAASSSNAGRQQQNISIESLSQLYAAAAAMELERSRKSRFQNALSLVSSSRV